MAKKVKIQLKLQIPGGKATPAPPVGTALGPHGLNLAEFCAAFNEKTRDRMGEVTPVVMTIYEDRSYSFVLKTAPVAEMIKKAAKIEKGAGNPLRDKVGKITKAQVREIAEKKMPDLNAGSIEAAMRTVEGTARQMGVTVTE